MPTPSCPFQGHADADMTRPAVLNGRAGRIGVGILGAGPVTQAIHLPTLARLGDTFEVVRIMDVDAAVADKVARRVDAAWTTIEAELLSDPAVEVVAICSPHPFHAQQVIAACRAGKRAILCEKPFAVSGEEASAIAAVSEETGVPIVVGAMHAYDQGWHNALAGAPELVPHTIRSSIVLPPNSRFEDFATEVVARPPLGPMELHDAEAVGRSISGGVLGLAIHDLPLIRALLSRVSPTAWTEVEVLAAEPVMPSGYLIELQAGEVLIELHAAMSENWEPSWHLSAFDDSTAIDVEFTPSYVQAGSATATVERSDGSRIFRPVDRNGYETEWMHLAELARGAEPTIPLRTLIDDLVFALQIAERASDLARVTTAERSLA